MFEFLLHPNEREQVWRNFCSFFGYNIPPVKDVPVPGIIDTWRMKYHTGGIINFIRNVNDVPSNDNLEEWLNTYFTQSIHNFNSLLICSQNKSYYIWNNNDLSKGDYICLEYIE